MLTASRTRTTHLAAILTVLRHGEAKTTDTIVRLAARHAVIPPKTHLMVAAMTPALLAVRLTPRRP